MPPVQLSTSWPFAALVGAVSVGYTLLSQPIKTQGGGQSTVRSWASWSKRFDDVDFWMKMAFPMYMLHQFEEYGIDLRGRHFFFIETLCGQLGYPLASCPIQPWHLTYVNCGLVICSALRCRLANAAPILGSNFYGMCTINALIHITFCIRAGEFYNGGLATAILMLFPSGVLCFRALLKAGQTTRAGVARSLLVGVVAHIGVLGGLKSRAAGLITDVPWMIVEFIALVVLMNFNLPGF